MRKYLIFIFTVILFIGFNFPIDTKAAIADGTYSLQYQVNKPGSNSASMANDYFLKPAKLIVKNGNMVVQLTINKSKWVTQFNPPGGAKIIATNETADQRTVQFSVSNASLTTIAMKIDIEDIDYHHAYSVDFVFNTEDLPEAKVEEPKQQAQQTTQQPAQTNPQNNTTNQTQSSGSNTSSNKPATTKKESTESSNAQTVTTKSTDDSTQSAEQVQTSSTDEQKAVESEAVENPETSDELPIFALLFLIVAMIVFIRTKQTKIIK